MTETIHTDNLDELYVMLAYFTARAQAMLQHLNDPDLTAHSRAYWEMKHQDHKTEVARVRNEIQARLQ